MQRHKTLLLSIIVVLLLDQLSKSMVMEWLLLNLNQPYRISAFFSIVSSWNKGISFGILANQHYLWLWVIISTIMAILLFYRAVYGYGNLPPVHSQLGKFVYGAVIGGALGNMLDRLCYGAVFDFIELHVSTWYWPAFNLADSAIVLGTVLLIFILPDAEKL